MDNGHTTNYQYDATNELTSDGTHQYSYDLNGNRTMAGYAIGPDNQILSDGTWTNTYDAEGNLTQQVNIATGAVTQFGYDQNNREIWVKQFASSSGPLQSEVTYTYDVLGNRIEEDDWSATGGTSVTHFAYDGTNIWGDFNSNNVLQTRRLYVDGQNTPAARITNGQVNWYLTDHLGSVRDITNAAGAEIDHTDYDAFGNILYVSNPSVSDRYGFQGGQQDTFQVSWHFGQREENPLTGNWLYQQDVLGFGAGSMNLQEFVGNAPTNGTDPTGQFFVTQAGAKDQWVQELTSLGLTIYWGTLSDGRNYYWSPDYQKIKQLQQTTDGWQQGVMKALLQGSTFNREGNSNLGIVAASLSQQEVWTMGEQINSWQAESQGRSYTPRTPLETPTQAFWNSMGSASANIIVGGGQVVAEVPLWAYDTVGKLQELATWGWYRHPSQSMLFSGNDQAAVQGRLGEFYAELGLTVLSGGTRPAVQGFLHGQATADYSGMWQGVGGLLVMLPAWGRGAVRGGQWSVNEVRSNWRGWRQLGRDLLMEESGTIGPQGNVPKADWVRPKGWQLPKNGTWEGTPGNSNFKPTNPAELGLKPGEVVPFRNGRPDFSQWSKGNFKSKTPLTGDPVADRTTMIKTIAEEKGWTQQQVKDWLQKEQLSLHHAGGNDIQLIPWSLHGNRSTIPPISGITHQGGSYDLRTP